MAACKDKLINIPVNKEDVLNTVQNLPRTPNEAGLLEVKLKRKMEFKNVHQQSYIDPKKIYDALEFLKKNGHPHYQFFDDFEIYKKRCKAEDSNGCHLVFIDANDVTDIVDIDVFNSQICSKTEMENASSLQSNEKNEDGDQSEEDEEYHRRNDVIKKFQFDYDKSVCMTERFPEAVMA